MAEIAKKIQYTPIVKIPSLEEVIEKREQGEMSMGSNQTSSITTNRPELQQSFTQNPTNLGIQNFNFLQKNIPSQSITSTSKKDDPNYGTDTSFRKTLTKEEIPNANKALENGYTNEEIREAIELARKRKAFDERPFTDKQDEIGAGFGNTLYNKGVNLLNNLRRAGVGIIPNEIPNRNLVKETLGEDIAYNSNYVKGGDIAGEIVGDTVLTAPIVGPSFTAAKGIGKTLQILGGIGEGILSSAIIDSSNDKPINNTDMAIGGGVGAVIPFVGPILKSVLPKDKYNLLTKEVGNYMKNIIMKGLKPTVKGKQNISKFNEFIIDTINATESIVRNKANLIFNEGENIITGKLPKTLEQFSSAIQQTKKHIYEQYTSLAKKAGQAGLKIELKPIINELMGIVDNEAFKLQFRGKLGKEVNAVIDILEKKGSYTVEEAQKAIESLNQNLNIFFKNPSLKDNTSNIIDILITNNLRKQLDEGIEKILGQKGYQELRNQYKSLRGIEEEVQKRAVVDMRKNTKGLLDFTDIYTADKAVDTLLKFEPVGATKSLLLNGIKERYKYLNNPNTYVRKLFDTVEKQTIKQAKRTTPPQTFKKVAPTKVANQSTKTMNANIGDYVIKITPIQDQYFQTKINDIINFANSNKIKIANYSSNNSYINALRILSDINRNIKNLSKTLRKTFYNDKTVAIKGFMNAIDKGEISGFYNWYYDIIDGVRVPTIQIKIGNTERWVHDKIKTTNIPVPISQLPKSPRIGK